MFTDLKQAARLLAAAPGFTFLIVAVLMLGIGANTAIFSIVNGVLLKPLPFPDAERLIAVQSLTQGDQDGTASVPDVADLQAATTVQDVVGYTGGSVILTGRGEATTLLTTFVTGDLMRTLGAPLLRGRSFSAADVRPGAAPVAVIAERLWRERFGGDPSLVGRTIQLGGKDFTVLGVMPPWFRGIGDSADLWAPLHMSGTAQDFAQRGSRTMKRADSNSTILSRLSKNLLIWASFL